MILFNSVVIASMQLHIVLFQCLHSADSLIFSLNLYLTCIIHEKFITKIDLVNSAALYSKNVLNVQYSTTSLIFLRMPFIINHLHHLITKSGE